MKEKNYCAIYHLSSSPIIYYINFIIDVLFILIFNISCSKFEYKLRIYIYLTFNVVNYTALLICLEFYYNNKKKSDGC